MKEKDKQTQNVKRYTAAGLSMLQEMEELLRVIRYEREQIQLLQLGKTYVFDSKNVKAISDLALAMTRLADSKMKFDKYSKSAAEEQTPEEERETVKAYIQNLSKTERRKLLNELMAYHNLMGDETVLGANHSDVPKMRTTVQGAY